jgi:hypothetical protein
MVIPLALPLKYILISNFHPTSNTFIRRSGTGCGFLLSQTSNDLEIQPPSARETQNKQIMIE